MSEAAKENPWIDICPGIRRRTVTHGATMYQMIAELKAGSKMPEHQHPQEQIIHILAGRMRVFANGGTHELRAGESYYLASNVPHGVETPEDTKVLDTFSPHGTNTSPSTNKPRGASCVGRDALLYRPGVQRRA